MFEYVFTNITNQNGFASLNMIVCT